MILPYPYPETFDPLNVDHRDRPHLSYSINSARFRGAFLDGVCHALQRQIYPRANDPWRERDYLPLAFGTFRFRIVFKSPLGRAFNSRLCEIRHRRRGHREFRKLGLLVSK